MDPQQLMKSVTEGYCCSLGEFPHAQVVTACKVHGARGFGLLEEVMPPWG